MYQLPVNVEECSATLISSHQMILPDFIVKSFSAHDSVTCLWRTFSITPCRCLRESMEIHSTARLIENLLCGGKSIARAKR